MMAGIKMMHDAHLDNRNTLIAATALCMGVGATQVDGFFDHLPAIFGEIFAGNMVAGVFVVGLLMEILLPNEPALYEAFIEKIEDGIDDLVDVDTNLFYETEAEHKKRMEEEAREEAKEKEAKEKSIKQ